MSTTMSHIPNWTPLETVMIKRGDVNECGKYMFMGSSEIDGTEKHLYKNINTRRYITLDDDCKFFIGTEEVTEERAFEYVLS